MQTFFQYLKKETKLVVKDYFSPLVYLYNLFAKKPSKEALDVACKDRWIAGTTGQILTQTGGYNKTLIDKCPNKDVAKRIVDAHNSLLNREIISERIPGIEYGDRWSQGIPHDTRSIELYKRIEQLDFEINNDYFRFKSGGDGDNGEILMYLLDTYFEEKDAKTRVSESV